LERARAFPRAGKLRRTGIADVVDGWCVSEAVGARKPDPAMFELALSRVGAATGEASWMVGDNPTADIAGASAAGLATLWVSHGQRWPLGGCLPDRTAASPSQALAMLASV
jgi:putative hydrolase of the HAD superfamily